MPLVGPGTPVGFRAGGVTTDRTVQTVAVSASAQSVAVSVSAQSVSVTVSPASIIASGA